MTIPIWYVFGLWILQFVLFRHKRKSTPVKTAANARWGFVLQTLGLLGDLPAGPDFVDGASTSMAAVRGSRFWSGRDLAGINGQFGTCESNGR
jgi:hypothetical protein